MAGLKFTGWRASIACLGIVVITLFTCLQQTIPTNIRHNGYAMLGGGAWLLEARFAVAAACAVIDDGQCSCGGVAGSALGGLAGGASQAPDIAGQTRWV